MSRKFYAVSEYKYLSNINSINIFFQGLTPPTLLLCAVESKSDSHEGVDRRGLNCSRMFPVTMFQKVYIVKLMSKRETIFAHSLKRRAAVIDTINS